MINLLIWLLFILFLFELYFNFFSCNILHLRTYVKLGTFKKIFLSSELNCKKNKSDKIIEICKQLKYNNYLSTSGSLDYLREDLDLFKRNKINVYIHNYKHPIYSQNFNKFSEYACILDLIFNEGEASYKIIKSGRKKSTIL